MSESEDNLQQRPVDADIDDVGGKSLEASYGGADTNENINGDVGDNSVEAYSGSAEYADKNVKAADAADADADEGGHDTDVNGLGSSSTSLLKESTLRWRKSVLKINASLRFRHTTFFRSALSDGLQGMPRASSASLETDKQLFSMQVMNRMSADQDAPSTSGPAAAGTGAELDTVANIQLDMQTEGLALCAELRLICSGYWASAGGYLDLAVAYLTLAGRAAVNWFGHTAVIPLIFYTLRKIIQLQPTFNAAALILNFVAVAAAQRVSAAPLTMLQLLWANLLMDILNTLTNMNPMHQQRQDGTDQRLIDLARNVKARNLLCQVGYQVAVLLPVYFGGKQLLQIMAGDILKTQSAGHAGSTFRPAAAPCRLLLLHDYGSPLRQQQQDIINTIVFNALVLCQLFDAVNRRQPDRLDIFKGLLSLDGLVFMAAWCTMLIVQVAFVECFHNLASTVKLRWTYWVICASIGFLSWPTAVAGKFIPVPAEPWLYNMLSSTGLVDNSHPYLNPRRVPV
ncbi:hypothetical protein GOP47_0016098 [Adiantum capillus-veneris]|uniref:Cation-transporting P-type ATPase C-terminal domain-containing protein n=1 Tax=Adiantum capillus-veneris TaxID=13818 RepID=A0A9D4UL79_ADICA|nr:hypothetical protein GOP47_0016098 [Adiantum capillus-veneris]